MNELDLETEYRLFGFEKKPDGLTVVGAEFYVCPDCEEGYVTGYGGGLFMCGKCDFQL